MSYLLSLFVCLLLAGCAPVGSSESTPYLETTGTSGSPGQLTTGAQFSLHGSGSPQVLTCRQAEHWYSEFESYLNDPERRAYATERADSDDLYHYSRSLQTHIVSLLGVFRVTGDLAILDEVDRLAQLMRGNLHDSWRDTADGSDGRSDGYLNWVWRQSHGEEVQGKDISVVDELRTHAMVANFAAAFGAYRDSRSPSGVDYGERADFWLDYLENHFEEKWRKRNEVDWPKFPFLGNPYMHQTVNFVKYHYYMHQLTGKSPYLEEANRLSELALQEFRRVTLASEGQAQAEPGGGTEEESEEDLEAEENGSAAREFALVWPRALEAGNDENAYLMPATYARYVYGDAVDLHLEGFGLWSDNRLLEGMANTLTELMLDLDELELSRDVGGGRPLGGIARSPSSTDRIPAEEYAYSPYALALGWDTSGELWEFSELVYETLDEDQRGVHIPAGFVIALAVNGCEVPGEGG